MPAELTKPTISPLDDSFYTMEDSDELTFFKQQTGIQDESDLKEHILAVQAKAYEVQRRLTITVKFMITDWGGSLAFWNYGHDLFRSTPASFPALFIEGDAFDPAVITPRDPFYALEDCAPLERPLSSFKFTSLTPLQGRLSAIHASSFFHLFDETEQLQLARQVATLLSPAPGSIIFGSHGGTARKRFRTVLKARTSSGKDMFCHSPETWEELWDGEVFKKGTVKVKAGLQKMPETEVERKGLSTDSGSHIFIMWWSVTRL
ncbi:hypothetical protein DXG01_002884 [Tephrocybe rancida]|nr:hypothetical protein DXG01_002884 [Tephrocybe rancida]